MKRMSVIIFCLVMLFSLSSCRSNKEIYSNSSVNSSETIISSEITDTIDEVSSENTTTEETSQETSSATETVNSIITPISSVATPSNNNISSTVSETVSNTIEDAKDKIENITDSVVPDIKPVVPEITPPSSNTSGTTSENPFTPTIPADMLFKFGAISNNTYENKFLGIGCTLGSDWIVLSEEEIKEYNGISPNLTAEEIDNYILNSFLIIDMVATKDSEQSSVMMLTMSDLGTGSFAELDMNEYVNTVVNTTRETLSQSGYENVIVVRQDISADGKTFYATKSSGTLEGITTYQTSVFIKDGYYLSLFNISATSQEEFDDILNSIYIPQ